MSYAERAKEVINIEIEAMNMVRDGLSTRFDHAIELILSSLNAGGKIVITGIGKNIHIGKKIAATLSSTGSPAIVLHPIEALHGDIGILRAVDVVIAMSYSGETEELLGLFPSLKRIGVNVVAMTGVLDSTLAKHSDEVIHVPVEREACPFNLAPTSSTTTTLAVGDALAIVLLEARGFHKKDFALLHPGGSIGRTLFQKAGDIMRTGDRVALVQGKTPIQETVLAMTKARSGSVAVVDTNNVLLGIFTDGDLRRHIQDDVPIEQAIVSDYMTKNPITVNDTDLAVEVLAMYEKYNIDDLVVLNSDSKVVGMIDIQDLPKMKIL